MMMAAIGTPSGRPAAALAALPVRIASPATADAAQAVAARGVAKAPVRAPTLPNDDGAMPEQALAPAPFFDALRAAAHAGAAAPERAPAVPADETSGDDATQPDAAAQALPGAAMAMAMPLPMAAALPQAMPTFEADPQPDTAAGFSVRAASLPSPKATALPLAMPGFEAGPQPDAAAGFPVRAASRAVPSGSAAASPALTAPAPPALVAPSLPVLARPDRSTEPLAPAAPSAAPTAAPGPADSISARAASPRVGPAVRAARAVAPPPDASPEEPLSGPGTSTREPPAAPPRVVVAASGDAPATSARERPEAATAPAGAAAPAAPTGPAPIAAANEPVPASSVKLPPDAPASWRERLSGALGERLQVHVGRSGEQAVIRLDPPQLGRIDISIRHETGALQVHLSASNGDVLRQLAGMGEGLRQDLAQRRHGDVAVTVSDRLSDGARDGGGRPPRQPAADTEDNAPGRALADAEAGAAHVPFATAPDRE